jgi:GTP-binding nuclear protein Ran
VEHHLTGEFNQKYNPTLGVTVNPIVICTSAGPIRFNVWDVSGHSKVEGYYIMAQCAIIMFDLTTNSSYQHISQWYNNIIRVCGNIPIILIGNKFSANNQISPSLIQQVTTELPGMVYCEVNVQAGDQLEQPFITLARTLLGDSLIQPVTIELPVVTVEIPELINVQ